jgi:hypothetical protein
MCSCLGLYQDGLHRAGTRIERFAPAHPVGEQFDASPQRLPLLRPVERRLVVGGHVERSDVPADAGRDGARRPQPPLPRFLPVLSVRGYGPRPAGGSQPGSSPRGNHSRRHGARGDAARADSGCLGALQFHLRLLHRTAGRVRRAQRTSSRRGHFLAIGLDAAHRGRSWRAADEHKLPQAPRAHCHRRLSLADGSAGGRFASRSTPAAPRRTST